MKKSLLGLAFAFAMTNASAGLLPPATYFTIDDFNTTSEDVSVSGSAGTNNGPGPIAATVFGGTRDIVTVSNGILGVSTNVIAAPAGILAFSTDAVTTGMTTLSYSSLVGIDLLQGQSNSYFGLDTLALNTGGINVTITVDGVSQTFTPPSPNSINTIDFSAFVGVDFTSVNNISLKIIATEDAADATFDAFVVGGQAQMPMAQVPVVSSLPLLGLGLVAFGFGRRKVK